MSIQQLLTMTTTNNPMATNNNAPSTFLSSIKNLLA
jgi:hypothetical protein